MRRSCSITARYLMRAAAVGVAASFTPSAFAQANAPVRSEIHAPIDHPVAGGLTFMPARGADGPADRPNHPPISQIRPMPMRTYTPSLVPPTDLITIINSQTGEIRELPGVADPGPLGERLGRPSSPGARTPIVNELEQAAESFGTMAAQSGLTAYPKSGNVKLFMRFIDLTGGTQWFTCSGTMLDSGVVLTAAHCVYARDIDNAPDIFDSAEEVYIYPAWDGVGSQFSTPTSSEVINNFGWSRGDVYLVSSDWINNGDLDRDVAAIRINRGSSRMVGMLTGTFGYGEGGCNANETYHNYSYPAETCSASLHTGQTMYYWNGPFDSCPALTNRYRLNTGSGCTTAVWGGMSGSGAYRIIDSDRFVWAVCSTSDRMSEADYCKLWPSFFTSLGDFEDDTRGTTFDIEALEFRVGGSTTVPGGTAFPDATVVVANATNANPASRTYTLRVYLSDNNNISSGDTLLATYNYVVDFGAHESRVWNVPGVVIPLDTAPGDYSLGVEIDPGEDAFPDNNETDTWDAQTIVVALCSNPPAPTGVSATDGTNCGNVTISWTGNPNATTFNVYRNTTNNSGSATLIAVDSASPYIDSPPTTSTYYYWVKAVYPCGSSALSAVATGHRDDAPPVPTTIDASYGEFCNRVHLDWTAVPGADTYRIFRNTALNPDTATRIATDLVGTSYNDTTADPGTIYYYWMKSVNACGASDYSTSRTGFREADPQTVTNVAASDSTNCNGVHITWNPFVNADSFSIYRNTTNSAGTATLLIGNYTDITYDDTTGTPGTTYYYWVRNVNACGMSAAGTPDQGTRRATPDAPLGVSASDGTICNGVTVSWNSAGGADTYSVLRNTVNNLATATTLASGLTASPYIDTTPIAGTTYFYWVRSVNPCGNATSVSNSGFRRVAPAAPTNVGATDGTTCNSVSISFVLVLGADSYSIYRNSVNSSAGATLVDNTPSSPGTDVTATPGTTYYYFVRANNPCGQSPFSASDAGSAGSTPSITLQPVDRTVREGESTTFRVTIAGATAYQWRRNGVNIPNAGPFSGADTNTLTINPVTAVLAGNYRCSITAPCGNVVSDIARLIVRCPADVDDGSGSGTPDGGVTIDDLLFYLSLFEAGDVRADVDDGSGTGTTDGGVTIDDLLYFLARFEGGC